MVTHLVTINIIAEREADATAKKHQELLKKKIQKNCGIRIVYIAKVHSQKGNKVAVLTFI